MVRWSAILVGFAMLWGCGTGEAEPSWECVPGKTQACVCDDGLPGAQTCDNAGSGFEACVCVAPADVSSPDISEPDSVDDTQNDEDTAEDVSPILDVEDATGDDLVEDTNEIIEDVAEDTGIDVEPDLPPQDAGPQPCDPPLSIDAKHYGLVNTTVVLKPSGGTGAYRFELLTNASDAMLDEIAGLHVLGEAIGAVDTVEVTDLGCVGSVTTTVEVIERFEVEPGQIQVGTGDSFKFVVTKGSGLFEFNFLTNASGGTLDPDGTYTAGEYAAVDAIEIVDTGAGTVETAGVVVLEDATIEVAVEADVLLEGQGVTTKVSGGSGLLGLVEGNDVCTYQDEVLRCDVAGDHALVFEDIYSLATVTVNVRVASNLAFVPLRAGDQIDDHTTHPVGDLNGDGIPDAILGSAPASVEATNGGAVYVYRGQVDGLETAPAQVIGHPQRDSKFGQSYAVGSFRGNGTKDLVVSAERVTTESFDRVGWTYLYEGTEDGFFSEEPAMTWEGQGSYAYYGSALAACDFNGDGFEDLAVGSYAAEDPGQDPVHAQQGLVYIYLGGVLGLSAYPDGVLRGRTYSGGEWVDQTELRMGISLAAGDVNGDGACDLVVGAEHHLSKSCDDGAVFVYHGIKQEGLSSGGVDETPAYGVYGPHCLKTSAGFLVAVGDVDGDDLADVIIPQKNYFPDGVSPSSNTYGRVLILTAAHMLGQLDDPFEPVDVLPVIAEGGAGDREGYWVSAGDVNGDGIDDAIVGSREDEFSGSSNAGTIRVFYGKDGAIPDPEPSLEWEGQSNYERFGGATSVIGDLDGDGASELFLFSAREDSIGYDVGRAFLIWGSEDHTFVPLEYPEEAAGDEFGSALAMIEFPGDALRLAVAAPRHNLDTHAKSGGVYIYAIDKGVLDADNPAVIDTHPKLQNGAQFGYRVASVGDFDGDGLPDLGVISYGESDPNSYPSSYECGPSCGGEAGTLTCGANIGGVGNVYIYRGQADGTFGENASFVFYSDQAYDRVQSVAGVGNVNGDVAGRADVAIGSRTWDSNGADSGGVRIITGRAYTVTEGKIQVICEPEAAFNGKKAGDNMGRTIGSLGDLNGDGCDDFAFGEDRNDDVNSDRGAVTIVMGSGGPSCPASWTTLRLLPPNDYRYTGWSVAGGGDIDGDGILDLLVGVPYDSTVLKPGRAVLVSGAYVTKLVADGVAEAPLLDPDNQENLEMIGNANKGYCGVSVALLPDYEADGRAAAAMGCRRGKYGGMERAGGAAIFRYTPGIGFPEEPELIISGERARPESYAGDALVFHKRGDSFIGAMGAPFGNANGLDAGSAYLFPVEAP